MGDRVRQCVREEDIVARWGGDEFVIVLSDIKQNSDVVYIANMILNFLSEPLTLGDKERVVISTSIGISLYPTDGDAPKQLVENADMAMYKAKQSGGNCYQFYTAEMNVAVIERLSMETGLRTALEMNHFELHYQPLLDMQNQRIIGAEALLRWNHPKKGLIPPDKFIPVAEESGLIIPIGEWVVNEACRQCNEWHEQQLTDLKINVNLSARQFRDNNLVSMINDALHHSGLDPAYLTLEITESSAMENARETIAGLQTLKSVGIHLSIDDFGTGYSSLAYLKRFPIDTLKIDRSFVKDIDRDSDDRAIIRSIIAMGHSLNLAIVAEGVEKVEHINYLNEQHCDIIQGYFISKPLTNEDFVEFVRRLNNQMLHEIDRQLAYAPAMPI